MGEVVRLVDEAAGYSVDGQEGLMEWLRSWVEGFSRGEYGKFKSVVVVLEGDDGRMATISQSLGALDSVRCAGLLTLAAHRHMDGHTGIERLRVD